MANLDWKNLPFGYLKTDCNIRSKYKDGEWGKLEVSKSEYIGIHIARTVFIMARRRSKDLRHIWEKMERYGCSVGTKMQKAD